MAGWVEIKNGDVCGPRYDKQLRKLVRLCLKSRRLASRPLEKFTRGFLQTWNAVHPVTFLDIASIRGYTTPVNRNQERERPMYQSSVENEAKKASLLFSD